jgi:hypothetical protein
MANTGGLTITDTLKIREKKHAARSGVYRFILDGVVCAGLGAGQPQSLLFRDHRMVPAHRTRL